MHLKLDLAAKVGGHFFKGCDKIVTDAGAGASAGFDTHARIAIAHSFSRLVFRSGHAYQLNQQNSWIVA
jgi:hypothetical protein